MQSRPRIVETKSISSSEIFHIQTEHNWFLSKLCVSNMSIFKSWWSSIFFTAANRSFTSMLVKKKLFKRILGKESWKKVQKVAIFKKKLLLGCWSDYLQEKLLLCTQSTSKPVEQRNFCVVQRCDKLLLVYRNWYNRSSKSAVRSHCSFRCSFSEHSSFWTTTMTSMKMIVPYSTGVLREVVHKALTVLTLKSLQTRGTL